MSDFIAQNTLETISSLVTDLDAATSKFSSALEALQQPSASGNPTSPQEFVELLLALDEQISRTRLLLPLCTTGITVNDDGQMLTLSDLITQVRSEFDTLARAQLEALID